VRTSFGADRGERGAAAAAPDRLKRLRAALERGFPGCGVDAGTRADGVDVSVTLAGLAGRPRTDDRSADTGAHRVALRPSPDRAPTGHGADMDRRPCSPARRCPATARVRHRRAACRAGMGLIDDYSRKNITHDDILHFSIVFACAHKISGCRNVTEGTRMLRYLAAMVVLAGLANPAAAAVVVDPTSPTESSKTVFTAEGFSGNGLEGDFTLTADAPVTGTISGNGTETEISLFAITEVGATTPVASQTFLENGTSFTLAAIEAFALPAGDYTLSVEGDFTSAALSAEVSAVPLPGAVLLLASAVGGLGVYRRWSRAAA
jgi:hypothetical protein